MNIYERKFQCNCPNNGVKIDFSLKIETKKVILVEEIVDATTLIPTFHEAIADSLFKRFGGKQTMKAHHHGVDITTTRGFE